MSAPVVRNVVIGCGLLAAGVSAGWWFGGGGSKSVREPPPPERASSETTRPAARPVNHVSIQQVDTNAIRAAVRQAVSEELAAERAEASAEAEAEAAAAEPSAEVQTRLDMGHDYIAQAIAGGRWGPEQAGHLRQLGLEMTAEQYQELVRPLVIAINAGQVEPIGDGTPF
jgi:hypothetical protein